MQSAAAFCACLSFLAAPSARAAPRAARLAYERSPGAERCPDAQALRDAVAARLGYDPFRDDADQVVAAAVSGAPDGLSGRVLLEDRSGQVLGEQDISSGSRDCAELTSSLSLAISIAIDPLSITRPAPLPLPALPPPTVAVRPAPPRSESPPTFFARAGPQAAAWAAPSLAWGATVGFGAQWRIASLGLEGRADLPSGQPVAGGRADAELLYGALVPCLHAGVFGACGLVAAGAQRGWSEHLANTRYVATPYAAVGARATLEVPQSSRYALGLHVDLLAPVTRTTLLVDGSEVWTNPPLAASAGLEAIARFP